MAERAGRRDGGAGVQVWGRRLRSGRGEAAVHLLNHAKAGS